MLTIKNIQINEDAGKPAWVEIENKGGQVELASYGLRLSSATGASRLLWQGGETDILGGSTTLRLTDGNPKAEPSGLSEPRMVLHLPKLDLSPVVGGTLTLFWVNEEMDVKEETVTVNSGTAKGKPLYRVGNDLMAPDTRRYR